MNQPCRFRGSLRGGVVFSLLVWSCGAALVASGCSDVSLRRIFGTPSVIAEGAEASTFRIDSSTNTVFRAALVVDMSNSMFSGPCPDSIDTLIDNVPASPNCLGPTGVDPEGKRFEIIAQWLAGVQQKITDGVIAADQVKVSILTFSNPLTEPNWSLTSVNTALTGLGVTIPEGFVSIEQATILNHALHAMFARFHNHPYGASIPDEIVRSVDAYFKSSRATLYSSSPSSGTSIVAPAIQKLNNLVHAELTDLAAHDLVRGSHFEIAFLSDGVPKPHALHIKAAASYVWRVKKEVKDSTLCGDTVEWDSKYYCTGWISNADATNCYARCQQSLTIYADTGYAQIPVAEQTPRCVAWYTLPNTCSDYSDGSTPYTRWSSARMTCGQCFQILRDFECTRDSSNYSRECDTGYSYRDPFAEKIKNVWGDWLLNRHAQIIGDLKSLQNIFALQFPGGTWRMNFLRVDSPTEAYQTPAGELIKELNWIEHAKDYFARRHRFFVVKDNVPPLALFGELEHSQAYKIGAIYLYARNARMTASGLALVDSDGDGLADELEKVAMNPLVRRSNGVCLDIISTKYGCISVGCDPSVDRDGDGLNACEENIFGTDDYNPDSDGDSIIDSAELLFELNPTVDDQLLTTNADGFSNFDHFVRGYSPKVNLSTLPAGSTLSMRVDLVDYVESTDEAGTIMNLPRYVVAVSGLPVVQTQALEGVRKAGANEYVVVARVDSLANVYDTRWLSHVYVVDQVDPSMQIDLEDLEPLDLEAP